MRSPLPYLLFPALGLIISACGNPNSASMQQDQALAAIDVSLLDSNYAPQDSFFEFVNQKWIENNPIPASKSSWGAFYELREQSLAALKEIHEDAAASKAAAGSPAHMLGLFWNSAMDSAGIAQAAWTPLQTLFAEMTWTKEPQVRAQRLATLVRNGGSAPVSIYVYQDLKRADRYVLYMNQAGLGLPDRDYYFREGERAEKVRAAYKKYQVDLLASTGMSMEEAQLAGKNIYDLEMSLAKASMTLEELRDPYASYHPKSLKDLNQAYPQLDWATLFRRLHLNTDSLVLGQPKFMEQLNMLMEELPAETWTHYLRFHTANSFAKYMHPEAESLRFAFYGTELSGKTEMEPRWQRMVSVSDELLRDLLGQEYVKKHFDEQAKSRALALVENLKKALGSRLSNLDWMGDTTRAAALEKLDKMMVKIGYPDQWRSYEGLELKEQHLVLNYQTAHAFEFDRMAKKLGQEVDRSEWFMGPQTVNAYYNPTLNEIVFPAAILQPPFFFAEGDDAVNYGGIGMVIGHELTHGFDDQGRQFDAEGNLRSWWTKADEQRFNAKASRFVQHYNGYEPLPGVFINGELTQGENIADLGGMLIAWDAFKISSKGQSGDPIDGFSPEQRFFLSFAQIWRGHDKDAYLEQKLYTDPHSPGKYRVIGVLSNFPAFYEAFKVNEGHKLWLPDSARCTMW